MGFVATISYSQNPTSSEPNATLGEVVATRLIPLYYSRDTEKVIAMVRDSKGPQSTTAANGEVADASRSSDAIERVRITVMGEGMLHLRGPIEGVNAITRMVHEIDQPVGQVKLGFHVIQFSVTDDVAMKGVNGAVDRYLSHARHMSKVSQRLFRTALANVAVQYRQAYPERFEEAFFYSPCIENMRKLNGQNATLSVAMLDSRDVLMTLYTVALTNEEARQQILTEFQRLVAEELPRLQSEYQQSIATVRDSLAESPSFFKRLTRTKAEVDATETEVSSLPEYRFAQTTALLGTIGAQSNTINPIQVATARFQRALWTLRQSEAAVDAIRNDRLLLSFTASGANSAPQIQTMSGDVMDAASFHKLADYVIEEHYAKVLDLQAMVRSEVATLDGQLKRLTEAFEEDLREQFWKPALADLRRNSGNGKSRMGQVQSTTILTPDRTLARVSPDQVAVLDRPVRPVLLQEGLQVAQGIAQEVESLSQGGAVLAAGSAIAPGSAAYLSQAGLAPTPGQHLGDLVEASERITVSVGDDIVVTPVIQPDDFSVAFHLTYTHTPERSDEAETPISSGVQRHLVQADVNIPSLELQEVSRFRVAMNIEEQGNGIPLLEDIPALGTLFRPRRVAAAMTQENIILVAAVVYPSSRTLAGKLWLAMDKPEPENGSGPLATTSSALDSQDELSGWVVQTLRRNAHASLAEGRFPKRLGSPEGVAVSPSSEQPVRR